MKKSICLLLFLIISCISPATNQNPKLTSIPTMSSIHSNIKPTILVNPSSSLTVSPSINIEPIQSIIPSAIPIPEDIYASFEYPPPDELKFNNGSNNQSYEGSVLVIIDTYLMRDAIDNSQERDRYPRKVMVLKDSYDDLTDAEKIEFKKNYPNYTIFDRKLPLKGEVIYDGNLSNLTSWLFNANTKPLVFFQCLYTLNDPNLDKKLYPNFFENRTSQYDNYFSFNSIYSKDIYDLYKNLKKSNKEKIMRKNIKKLVFPSIKDLSLFSTYLKANVEYQNLFSLFYFPALYLYPMTSSDNTTREPYGLFDLHREEYITETWRRTNLSTSDYSHFLTDIFY